MVTAALRELAVMVIHGLAIFGALLLAGMALGLVRFGYCLVAGC